MPIEGMMNSQTYLPIIKRRITSELANRHSQAIFQHDSAPCRKAKIVTQNFKKMKLEILEWHDNSPDLNTIELQL